MKIADAIVLCERGLHHASAHLDLRTNLSSALQTKSELSDAFEGWKAVLGQPAAHFLVLANLFRSDHHLGRTGDAATMGEYMLAADQNNATAHINFGNAYLDRRELEVAKPMYARVTECDPPDNAKLETEDYSETRLC